MPRPDVILGQHSLIPRWVEAAGMSVPNDIGVVHLALDDDCLGGGRVCSAQKREIGAATANIVISLLQNNELRPTQGTDRIHSCRGYGKPVAHC